MIILGGVLITIAVGVFVFLGVACKRKNSLLLILY